MITLRSPFAASVTAGSLLGARRQPHRLTALALVIGALTLQSTTGRWAVSAQSPELVAAYAFDEGAGTTLQDFSGNGNSGTLSGGATWTAGYSGTAAAFDGATGKISLPSTLDISALPFTLETWV